MATKPDKPAEGIKRVRRGAKNVVVETIEGTGGEELTYTTAATAPAHSARQWSSMLSGGMGAVHVGQKNVTLFLRQLIMMLEAGTPLLKSLDTLALRSKGAVRSLISDIARYVEAGNPLWQAFERNSHHFDSVFINLVKASEASGTLVTVLQRLVVYRERREMLRKRVRGSMAYPVVLVFACIAVVAIISKVVIPQFKEIFTRLDMDIPVFTQRFIAFTDFVNHRWWTGLILLLALIFVYKFLVRFPANRIVADRLKVSIPKIGDILRKHAMVEFTRSTALLLRSGLTMMVTLDLVRNSIHNRAVAQVLQRVRESVERGEGIEQPLRHAPALFPPVVTDMLVTGEETGQLDNIAEHIANTYEEEVNISVSALGELIMPVLTIFMGAVVLLVMLAVFKPLIDMISQLGNQGGG